MSDNFLIGAMGQLDYAVDDLGDGVETSGRGWMVGPYVVAQLGEQPLFFEGRVLFGQSDNEISPFGTYTDEFETERMLTMLGVEGSYEAGRLSYYPEVSFSHARDRQLAYVDGLSNTVPEQTVSLTELALGVDFETPIMEDRGDHRLTWGVQGIWSTIEGDRDGFVSEHEGARGRLDLGYRFDNERALAVTGDVFLDGIGTGDFTSYGLSLGVSTEF